MARRGTNPGTNCRAMCFLNLIKVVRKNRVTALPRRKPRRRLGKTDVSGMIGLREAVSTTTLPHCPSLLSAVAAFVLSWMVFTYVYAGCTLSKACDIGTRAQRRNWNRGG